MSQAFNFDWPQGEDFLLSLVYKEGDTAGKALAVNLVSGYSARMDLVLPGPRTVILSATSEEEITLGAGLNGQPNLTIKLPRAVTLPGSPEYTALGSSKTLDYDLFVRNLSTDVQVKVIHGDISIKRSGTLWV